MSQCESEPQDMKTDYKISRVFQEISLYELETLNRLCELERTQIIQSLASSVLKIPYAGYQLSGNSSNFIDYVVISFGITKKFTT